MAKNRDITIYKMKIEKNLPKFFDTLLRFFGFFQILVCVLIMIKIESLGILESGLIIIFLIYIVPPLSWRLCQLRWKEAKDVTYFGTKVDKGNLWLASYHFQFIFNHLRFLEKLLLFFPGIYSAWLRLWGAKVGKGVIWAPDVWIVDRPFIEVGHRVMFGNKSYVSSHVIKKKEKGKYFVFGKKVKLGDDVFVSYRCTLSAGAKIASNSYLKAGTHLYPNEKYEGKKHEI